MECGDFAMSVFCAEWWMDLFDNHFLTIHYVASLWECQRQIFRYEVVEQIASVGVANLYAGGGGGLDGKLVSSDLNLQVLVVVDGRESGFFVTCKRHAVDVRHPSAVGIETDNVVTLVQVYGEAFAARL